MTIEPAQQADDFQALNECLGMVCAVCCGTICELRQTPFARMQNCLRYVLCYFRPSTHRYIEENLFKPDAAKLQFVLHDCICTTI